MADQPDPIVIEELIGNPPLRATLGTDDLPEGRRHEIAAFESGGKWDIADDGIYNPGANRVVLQIMSRKYHPMVLKGAFRDAFYQVGHARAQRDLFERIADRINPVKITWGDQVRQGVLWETSFGEESPNDITYELTFFIAVPQQGTQQQQREAAGSTDPSDLVSLLKAQVNALQAKWIAASVRAQIQAAIANMWNTAQLALDNALLAATIVATKPSSTAQQALSAARRVQATAGAAQDQFAAIKANYDTLTVDSINPTSAPQTSDQQVALLVTLMEGSDGCLAIQNGLRTLAVIATQQIAKTTRIYRVQQGDTPESIARTQLGSAARAPELGITIAQCVPGKLIRIPEAA